MNDTVSTLVEYGGLDAKPRKPQGVLHQRLPAEVMKAVTKAAADQAGAHLRLVSDRAAGNSASGIKLSGVSKTYRSRDGDVPSLRPLDFHINEGEFFVVVGPSGCGKSTLLKMISGLLPPTTGEIPGRRRAGDETARQCRHRVSRTRCSCPGATSSPT